MSAFCPHCSQEFYSTRGIFGQDAATLRDNHVGGCEENPRNKCYCGKVFPNSVARDAHATTCDMNPQNRFGCPHCQQEFVTTYGVMGLFKTDGKALRDAHVVGCMKNPANKCFCGQLFTNPEARNSHAAKCDMNPANQYSCQYCNVGFLTTFNSFGFRASDGRAERDAHQVCCEKNPKNVCYCGKLFPNPSAREKHAITCEMNPSNRFECPHCRRLFVTRFGMMGRVASDGKALRDAHEMGCDKNPANECFCGQLFPSPQARDIHAAKCEMNPTNRFTCRYCRATFVTRYGMFKSCGSVERDAHVPKCSKNPANVNCEHCGKTFVNVHGLRRWVYSDAVRRCRNHASVCRQNPANRFNCACCGRSFVSRRRWFGKQDGKEARDTHQGVCDVIPCSYHVVDTGFEDWSMLAPDSQDLDEKSNLSGALLSSQISASTSDCVTQEDGVDAALESTMLPDDDLEGFQDAESVADDDPSLSGNEDAETSSDEDGESSSVIVRSQYCQECSSDTGLVAFSKVPRELVLSGDDGNSSSKELELDDWSMPLLPPVKS